MDTAPFSPIPQIQMTLHPRVTVFAPNSAKLFVAEQQQAEELLGGGATVYSTRRGRVSAIQLSEGQIVHGGRDCLRPGSYGIKRENLAGHVVFDHRKTWAEELAA